MQYVFIAFYGWNEPEMKQDEKIFTISGDFECWNLKKFSTEEFIDQIKTKIPPVNDNVLRNYLSSESSTEGISEGLYKKCLWGILLPTADGDQFLTGYKKALSLINLFSPKFMSPAFYVTNFGIQKVPETKQIDSPPNDHQGYELFKNQNFADFYDLMYEQMNYFTWMRDIVLSWQDEDWRLFMAASFYEGLKEYDKGKSVYTWQRESADMATLLEKLFTAGDTQNEEIGYRLRKRISCLIGWKITDIEDGIKALYKDRSEFIHGAYYKKILRGMRRNQNDNAMPPSPDFEKLYKTKEYIRIIFVAYLYASKIKNGDEELKQYSSIQGILEESIINIELRNKLINLIKPVIELLPAPSNR